jgi:folylpolyglutamate synthase/dihydropteroate synthase
MIAPLAEVASAFFATTIPYARARGADQLAEEIRRLVTVPVQAEPSPDEAVARALRIGKRAVACGSIYMIGPLRARLIAAGATTL